MGSAGCDAGGRAVFKDDGFCGYWFTLHVSKLWRIQMQHQRLWDSSEHTRSVHVEHMLCFPPTSAKMYFLFIYLFLIKTNQLTCKITVLMFRALEKLCSVQMVSKACTGENRRQRRQTNKLANQKTFSLSIRRDIIPFLIKALTHLFFFFWWRLRP